MQGFLYVAAPGKVPPRLQIVKIALVGIGLALKRDVAVGIPLHGQAHQPLEQIGDIEEHEQHLALLRRVDALVVNQFIAQVNAMVHKQHPQQVNCRETAEGQNRGAHNLHGRKGTIFF